MSFHNLSNSCVRWRVGGFEREFLQQKFSLDGDDNASSSFHSITMRAERSRMTVGWATSTASLHCPATKKWPGQQKMTVDCQRRDLKSPSPPSTLPHSSPHVLQVTHSLLVYRGARCIFNTFLWKCSMKIGTLHSDKGSVLVN